MIDCISESLKSNMRASWLDIGAGNGSFYEKYTKTNPEGIYSYAIIEKSDILRNELNKTLQEKYRTSYTFYGADFQECTLFDKKVDYIFCNPPYSEFVEWTCKIIEQAYSNKAFLVIPQRWIDNDKIQHFIKQRGCSYTILGSFDFLNAERQARAKVDVIEFDFTVEYENRWREKERITKDPFNEYLKKEFRFTESEIPQEEFKREEVLNKEIEVAGSPIEAYVNAYQKELMSMQNTYYTLGTLYQENNKIFKELKIDIDVITKTLREKITALRIEYWNLFINNFDKIKERLTKYSREQLFSSLRENNKLDFTVSNCYALVIYAIENANKYFDSQIIDIFEKLSSQESIRHYKSNQKVYSQDEWRYKQEKPTHYTLDKRIIYSGHCDGWDKKTVNDSNLLEDLITIANNLGFGKAYMYGSDLSTTGKEQWISFEFKQGVDWDTMRFIEYRCFKNGNIHLRINQEFMKAFNIEVARLKGWIHNKEEIVKEFDSELGITEEDCNKYFKSAYQLTSNINQLLIELK